VLKNISSGQVTARELAGEPIEAKLTNAPGNDQPIGGIKVVARKRLVCRSPLRDRGRLQDLRGKLPQQ